MNPKQLIRRGLLWLGFGALALSALPSSATVVGVRGSLSGSTRSFEMFAADGYINAADGVQIYTWGYGASLASDGTGLMQYSGPTLLVNQGETVNISFTNRLPTRTSMLFPGQSNVTATGGTPGVLAVEALPGQTVTYSFVASQPGTYLYQSGSQPALQNEMGLVGALVVYPTGTTAVAPQRWAYNHAGSVYDRETLFVIGEMDSDIHAAVDDQVKSFRAVNVANPNAEGVFTADLVHRFPKYWFINGRTSPDVFAKNKVGELPHQPYNALPRMHPGEKMLLRMVGAGADLHPMHHHGNNSWEIARDGRMLTSGAGLGPNLAVSDYTIKVVPGQTTDAVWTWTGAGLGWDIYGKRCGGPAPEPSCASVYADPRLQHQLPADRGKAIPVRLPSEFELSYGEFYSGSPYLGDIGLKPVGAGFANTSGAFFHMFHSHNEREVVNGGIYPGGMMTMLVIEPSGVAIEATQP